MVRTPDDVNRLCSDIAELAQEAFQVISLDSKNRLINRHLVSLGLLDASLVHPREVFRTAIEDSASAIVLLHNHPSGDCTPSAEDIRITRQLIEAGKIVDIHVTDHVIVGRARKDSSPAYLSMREAGLCTFR